MLVLLQGAALGLKLFVLDSQHEQRLSTQAAGTDVLTSPGKDVLDMVAMEHPLAWADVMWLAIIQAIGAVEPQPAVFDRVERWAEIATDLDERYFVIYHSSAVYLSVYGQRADASDKILLKGLPILDRYEIPFMLGFNAYFIRGDGLSASDWMIEASKLKGAPHYLPALAGRMRFQAGDEEGSILILEMMAQDLDPGSPEGDDVRSRLKILKSERRLRKYDAACAKYVEDNKEFPTPAILAQLGYVDEPPEDLLGDRIYFRGEECVARTDLIKVREAEAKERTMGRFGEHPDPNEPSVTLVPVDPNPDP